MDVNSEMYLQAIEQYQGLSGELVFQLLKSPGDFPRLHISEIDPLSMMVSTDLAAVILKVDTLIQFLYGPRIVKVLDPEVSPCLSQKAGIS